MFVCITDCLLTISRMWESLIKENRIIYSDIDIGTMYPEVNGDILKLLLTFTDISIISINVIVINYV